MSGKVVHGARVHVAFEGTKIGVLTNITENEDYGVQGVYGIGNLTPQELVALRFSGTFNFSKLVLSSEKISELQYAERAGKDAAAVSRAILTKEGFSVIIEDKYTKANIATIHGCILSNLSITVGENAIVTQNGSGQYGEPMITP